MNWRVGVLFILYLIMLAFFVLAKLKLVDWKIHGRSYGNWRAKDGLLVSIVTQVVIWSIYILLFVVFKPHE